MPTGIFAKGYTLILDAYWRHKILDTLNQDEGDSFSGIVESDETFFEDSEKGNRHLNRPGRKRGTDPKKPGISDDKVTVIVTADRKKCLNMIYCGHGRLTKKEIVDSLRKPLPSIRYYAQMGM